jgi:hypothetical protein
MTAHRDLESLLARALRDPSQAGASTEAIARVKAVGRAELARGGVPRHRWFSELLGAASDAVTTVTAGPAPSGQCRSSSSVSAARIAARASGLPAERAHTLCSSLRRAQPKRRCLS